MTAILLAPFFFPAFTWMTSIPPTVLSRAASFCRVPRRRAPKWEIIECMSDRDLQVIKECLDAAVDGPFFDDCEFHTLMGFTREEISRIARTWPHTDDPGEQNNAVVNVLNMLLGYPHDHWHRWPEYSSATPQEIAQVLARRQDDGAAFDGAPKGTFDRLR
ncbi:hypothetical protein HII36_11660 [Nonomuraea sp. NN258]|uniref:hypothetical protein n=1 Tax=Nonomuraea antri TaxID=2730852 RepID=UPI00156837E1|nr:hypothetical protein [Nonomuraea antri]NRQ32490.1 hypothetical protein [Nonomuraea antri]